MLVRRRGTVFVNKEEGIKEGDEIKLTFETEINGQIMGEPQSFTIKREKQQKLSYLGTICALNDI